MFRVAHFNILGKNMAGTMWFHYARDFLPAQFASSKWDFRKADPSFPPNLMWSPDDGQSRFYRRQVLLQEIRALRRFPSLQAAVRGWRNKCEFTIGRNAQGAVEVGFILRILSDGSQVIGSVQDVPLVPECMQRLCAVVAAFVENSSFPIYDRKARCGVWRTVLSRVNPKGDMLVMLQTTTIKEEERSAFVDPLVAELAATGLGICAIYHLYNDEVTDAPRPNALVTSLHGKPRLEMPMLELKLEIGPLSFFNPNTTTCRFLMETAIRYLKLRKSDILLDIFCGIGTIGLCAAGYCAKVIGVDIVQENIEDARRNAQQNSIPNTEFIVGKAEEVVPKILGDMDTSLEVVAVVDPSRAGLLTSGFYGSASGLPC
eukprot:s2414_g5.t6